MASERDIEDMGDAVLEQLDEQIAALALVDAIEVVAHVRNGVSSRLAGLRADANRQAFS